MRDCVGDQERQAGADAEKSLLLRDHYGVLEFDGCDLLARRVDAVGNSKLRQGAAAAGCGHGTWGESGPVPEYSRGLGVFVEVGCAGFAAARKWSSLYGEAASLLSHLPPALLLRRLLL